MGVSAREAAKVLGLTHPALLKAAKTGRITREKDGGYDVETVRRQLAENSNALKRRTNKRQPVTGPPIGPPIASEAVTIPVIGEEEQQTGNRTLAEAQRRREWIRVQKDELELARKRGELAPIGEINAWVAGMIIRAREVLTRIGPELKDRLAQEINPHECERLVGSEVDRALKELAEFRPNA